MSGNSNDPHSPRRAGSGIQDYAIHAMRLKMSLDVDDGLVERCYTSFQQNTVVADAIENLKSLEDDAAKSKGSTSVTAKKQELKMYPYLTVLFDHIQDFKDPAARNPPDGARRILQPIGKIVDDIHATMGYPSLDPDFSVTRPTDLHAPRRWREVDAFVEVKATTAQGLKPGGARATTVHSITIQSADYARLHMSSRPFTLFSVGLLIYGSQFSVAIFDRDGITLSPTYSMWIDTKIFIRIIRTLTHDLTAVELGHDPTARELPQDTMALLFGDTASSYPSFVIDPFEDDVEQRFWCTVGPPIWSSLSLLGRGGVVWRVRQYVKDAEGASLIGETKILKTAWRRSGRTPESTIYKNMQGRHPGVAVLLMGGDVIDPRPSFPDRQRTAISIHHLRQESLAAFEGTPVLHRLLLETVGRPLWEFRTELELMKGFRAAIEGHKFLWTQGILHRDISAGNVLLFEDPNAPSGHEGFITDVEFASLKQDDILHSETTIEPVPATPKVNDRGTPIRVLPATNRKKTLYSVQSTQRGEQMTGTLQFMAVELLRAIENKTRSVKHTPAHDLESFVLVFFYSLGRKLLALHPDSEALRHYFRDAFGKLTVRTIMQSRIYGAPHSLVDREFDPLSEVKEPLAEVAEMHLSPTLLQFGSVFAVARSVVRHRAIEEFSPSTVVQFTYDSILNTCDRYIAKLEKGSA